MGVSRIPLCLVSKSGWSWLSGSLPVAGVLHVASANFQCECSGSYKLAEGMRANGEHVWIQQTGSYGLGHRHYIYSGTGRTGRWCIGAKDTSLKSFSCNAGFIYHTAIHHGVLPYQLEAGRWMVWDGGQFQLDASITVTAGETTSVQDEDLDDDEKNCFSI
jgi:hypothetical protein